MGRANAGPVPQQLRATIPAPPSLPRSVTASWWRGRRPPLRSAGMRPRPRRPPGPPRAAASSPPCRRRSHLPRLRPRHMHSWDGQCALLAVAPGSARHCPAYSTRSGSNFACAARHRSAASESNPATPPAHRVPPNSGRTRRGRLAAGQDEAVQARQLIAEAHVAVLHPPPPPATPAARHAL